VARDLVAHYSTAWQSGKAMLVCIDKLTCVRMHGLIEKYWQERIQALEQGLSTAPDEQEETQLRRQIEWMRETRTAVVVSEEQGEVDTFKRWDLDITPHRRLIKEGFETADGERIDVESAFKKEDHPFRIAIVCAMWLTGFDVPCLATLYLDKPLKAHTLMQAIARANRVHEGKNNGLVVDYCGVLRHLRRALATFAGTGDSGRDGEDDERDPTRPNEDLLADLEEAIAMVRAFLSDRGASLDDIISATGFARNAAIVAAKEAANDNDETRKRFMILCREVFKKFRASINIKGVHQHRHDYDAINIIYKSLTGDVERADISDIIRQLHQVVDYAIETRDSWASEKASNQPYDISAIDFNLLRREFERSPAKKTTVQNLLQVIEQKLRRMLEQNPLRTDLQEHYERIVAEYNQEKDRQTIEATFDAIIKLIDELTVEESRAMREGLDEETLALFDILSKPDLGAKEIQRIKKVAVELLVTLKAEKLRIKHWRDRESTRDAVRVTIHDFLYSDQTGLPVKAYTEDEVTEKTTEVFQHVFRAYPALPSPFYSEAA
jgi:type I restriction enzyme R subunit